MSKKRIVWVIEAANGWIWDGLTPWVSSSLPARMVGITFRTQESGIAMAAQLKNLATRKIAMVVRPA